MCEYECVCSFLFFSAKGGKNPCISVFGLYNDGFSQYWNKQLLGFFSFISQSLYAIAYMYRNQKGDSLFTQQKIQLENYFNRNKTAYRTNQSQFNEYEYWRGKWKLILSIERNWEEKGITTKKNVSSSTHKKKNRTMKRAWSDWTESTL